MGAVIQVSNPARRAAGLRLSVFALGAALAFGQPLPQADDTPITQAADGTWQRSNGGSPAVPVKSQVRIVAMGNLVIHTQESRQLKFQFQQKVRARSLEQAVRLMGDLAVSAQMVRGTLVLHMVPESALSVHTDLEVWVPAQLDLLQIESRLGKVTVTDLDGAVRIHSAGGPILADRIGGSLVAQTGLGPIELGSIAGTVRCSSGGGTISLTSSGGEVNCATAGGDVVIGRSGGPVIASTEGGNIHVDYAGGDVQAHSATGLIQVEQARGAVYADTLSGSIQVGSAQGVKAESAAGMIRLRNASGPLTVSTALGNIMADLMAGTPWSSSSLMTRSGDITVRIPPAMGMQVRATNEAGITPRIVSDFPEIQVKSVGFRSPVMGQGAINGGGPLLNLSAAGGVIYLKRSK